jgi:hypothetical protein
MIRKRITKQLKKQKKKQAVCHCKICEKPFFSSSIRIHLSRKIANVLSFCEECGLQHHFSEQEIDLLDMSFNEKRKFFFGQ